MSNIGSVSSYLPTAVTLKSIQSNYEDNVKAYGPVAAGVAGLATAAGEVVSTVVSFSAESLDRLGDLAEAGFESVTGAISDVEDAVSDAVDSVESGLSELYTEVSDLASESVTAISDAASEVATGISDATASVLDGIGSAANSVAGYATLGVVAVKQTLSELA